MRGFVKSQSLIRGLNLLLALFILFQLFPIPAVEAASTRKIEQQINIIDQEFSCDAACADPTYAPTDMSLGLIFFDPASYTNPTVYFEASIRNSGACCVPRIRAALYTDSGTQVAGSVISTTDDGFEPIRSAALNLSENNYTVRINTEAGGTATINSARLIIIQEANNITRTETQIEIGDNESNSGGLTELTNKKLFLFEADAYDGTIEISFSATLKTDPGINAQAIAELWDATGNFSVPNGDARSQSTTNFLLDGSSFISLTDGHEYYVKIGNNIGPASGYIANAKIIISQNDFSKVRTYQQQVNSLGTDANTIYTQVPIANTLDPNSFTNTQITAVNYEATIKTSAGTGFVSLFPKANRAVIDSGGSIVRKQIKMGLDNFPRVAYARSGSIIFVQCLNADCSSFNKNTISAGGNASLAIGSDGFARIAYSGDAAQDLSFARCLNASCSSVNITSVDTAGNVGSFPSVALDASDLARISYTSGTDISTKYARCTNADCTVKTINVIEDDILATVAIDTSIALDSAGLPRIVFRKLTATAVLRYAECTNADCSALNLATIAATTVDNPEIAIGSDDLARIAYPDGTGLSSTINYVRCLDSSCTLNNNNPVNAEDTLVTWPSMVLGSDGFGRIHYIEGDDQSEKFVKCTNADCTTSDISYSATVTDFIAEMTIASDDTPRILEVDPIGSSNELLILRCQNDACNEELSTVSASYVRVRTASALSLSNGHFSTQIRNSAANTTSVSNSWLILDIAMPPPAPTGFLGSAASTTSIDWSWADISDFETGYRVHSSAHANVSGDLAANTTSWSETGLSPNTQYTRHAHAFNAIGESFASNSDSVYTLATGPSSPNSVSGHNTTAGYFIDVSWSAPPAGEYSSFRVYRFQNATCTGSGTLVHSSASASFRDGGLVTNTTYCYLIRSVNGDGIESISSGVTTSATTPTDDVAPTSTVTFPADGSTVNSVSSIIGSAHDDMGGVGVNKVEISIQRLSDGLFWDGSGWTGGSIFLSTSCVSACSVSDGTVNWSRNFGLPVFDNNTRYTIRSRATDRVGNVEAPSVGNTFLYDNNAPSRVTLLSPANGSQTTDTKVKFSWSASTDSESGFAYYELWVDGKKVATTTALEAEIRIKLGGHTWFVRAFDNAGNFSESEHFSFSVVKEITLVHITELRVINITKTSFDIFFTTNIPTRASVTCTGGGETKTVESTELSTSHQVTFDNLKPGIEYTCQVTITDGTPGNTETTEIKAKTLDEGLLGTGLANSLLAALIKLIRSTPPPIAYSFPWLLFLLILLLIQRLLSQTRKEISSIERIKGILNREKVVAEEKDSFLSLSAHYLRTPAAILSAGTDLLERSGTVAASVVTELKGTIGLLSSKVKTTLEEISNNQFLSEITVPDIREQTIRGYTSPHVWVPLVLVGALAILSNFLFIRVGNINIALLNLITQLLVFVLVAVYLITSYRKSKVAKQNHENFEKLLNHQVSVDSARNEFIRKTKENLGSEVTRLKAILAKTPPEQTKFLNEGESRLENILQKFSILSEIEAGKLSENTGTFSIGDVTREIPPDLSLRIKLKQLKVQTLGPEALITSDKEKIRLILRSLLDNSIKFSKDGGLIEIESDVEAGKAVIRVRDYGAGISEEGKQHLFKPFTRGTSTEQFTYEGIGFSLYLSKIVANYLGGDLTVESTLGKGTTAILTIPAGTSSVAPVE